MDDNQPEEITASSKELSFNVFTLNCWGLFLFSKDRFQRIQSIAQYLREQKYDFVFLQELWMKTDFEHIREETASIYKFAHLFPTKSILGTSGLAILSKWNPAHISFMPFTVNGSPFRPWHGDWFTGKGTAYVRVEIKDLRIHLFCTHMHAQYSDNEAIDDQYSIHRICQSYQLGKFINTTKDLVSDIGKSSDLFILAGDLNSSPDEFAFQLLESITGLHNISYQSHHGGQESSSRRRSDLATCGHPDNSYTTKQNNNQKAKKGKQIDFILYKLINKRGCDRTSECFEISSNENPFNCMAERLHCSTKDPETSLSFSDHQPVAVRLKIKKTHSGIRPRDNGDVGYMMTNGTKRRGSIEIDANGYTSSTNAPEMLKQEAGRASVDKVLKLMKNYINENESSKQKLTYSLSIFGLALIIAISMANFYRSFMDPVLLFVSSLLLFVILTIILIVIEIVYRFEQHGIASIIEEMNCLLTSSSYSASSSSGANTRL